MRTTELNENEPMKGDILELFSISACQILKDSLLEYQAFLNVYAAKDIFVIIRNLSPSELSTELFIYGVSWYSTWIHSLSSQTWNMQHPEQEPARELNLANPGRGLKLANPERGLKLTNPGRGLNLSNPGRG